MGTTFNLYTIVEYETTKNTVKTVMVVRETFPTGKRFTLQLRETAHVTVEQKKQYQSYTTAEFFTVCRNLFFIIWQLNFRKRFLWYRDIRHMREKDFWDNL
jgi:hypothetical protein